MKGFYELEKMRQGILDEVEIYEEGSEERKIANTKVKELKENSNYLHLKDKLKMINYCINVCFY